ncbi:MAG: hypothetical protein ACTH0V_02800 [Microbacteriaceae bacterium]
MRALAEGIRQEWTKLEPESIADLRGLLRIVAAATSLRGTVERNSEATITALVGALADRGVTAVAARVASTAMISGLSVALLDWAQSDQAAPGDALGRALDALGGSASA